MPGRRLVVVSERDHSYIDLDEQGTLSIGRSPENDIVVKDDMVSRRHCLLEPEAGGLLKFRDLKSFNGTYLNERRVREGVMQVWDALRVGRTKLLLVEGGPAPAGEEDAPPAPEQAASALDPAIDAALAAAPAAAEAAEAAVGDEGDLGATKTLDLPDLLASKELRAIIDGVVRREREDLERQVSRRVRDESGPAVLASLGGLKVRVRRLGPGDGGGDFYDVFRDAITPGELGMTLGSVSGVGIAACVAATTARHTLRGICAGRTELNPREAADLARELLAQTLHPGSAVSLLLASIGPAGKGRIAAVGGTGALFYSSATAKVEVLRPPGRRDEEALRTEVLEVGLKPGDRLLLVSDGAGSLRGTGGESYGIDRLVERFGAKAAGCGPKELVKQLAEDYAEFSGMAPERDVTLMIAAQVEE